MGKFCHKHVKERTVEELRTRKNQLIGLVNTGPGQRAELVRIDLELDRRAAEAAEAAKEAVSPS